MNSSKHAAMAAFSGSHRCVIIYIAQVIFHCLQNRCQHLYQTRTCHPQRAPWELRRMDCHHTEPHPSQVQVLLAPARISCNLHSACITCIIRRECLPCLIILICVSLANRGVPSWPPFPHLRRPSPACPMMLSSSSAHCPITQVGHPGHAPSVIDKWPSSVGFLDHFYNRYVHVDSIHQYLHHSVEVQINGDKQSVYTWYKHEGTASSITGNSLYFAVFLFSLILLMAQNCGK